MKTIQKQLKYIKKNKKIGLMTHAVIGYPSLRETESIVLEMEKVGVDFIEMQIPFSDPLADGPIIMQANDIALKQGITLEDCFSLAKKLSRKVKIPLLFMAYYNTVFHYGVEKFCKKSNAVGIQGLIIPDIPIDEERHEGFIKNCNKYNLHHIRLLSPSSTSERIKLNAKLQNAFVYCTAQVGTTGAKDELHPSVKKYLKKVKKFVDVPLAVGFGISKPKHIKSLIGHAEIAVVGSAVISRLKNKEKGSAIQLVKTLVDAGL